MDDHNFVPLLEFGRRPQCVLCKVTGTGNVKKEMPKVCDNLILIILIMVMTMLMLMTGAVFGVNKGGSTRMGELQLCKLGALAR